MEKYWSDRCEKSETFQDVPIVMPMPRPQPPFMTFDHEHLYQPLILSRGADRSSVAQVQQPFWSCEFVYSQNITKWHVENVVV